MTETKKAILAIIGAIVFLGVALAIATTLKGPTPEQVRSDQEQLRAQLVWGCEFESNPLRKVVQSLIREDIRHVKKIKPSYFPGIPPHVLHRLIHAQIVSQKRHLEKAAPVNCEGIYPPTP